MGLHAMLRKSSKDHSGKLAAVVAVLDQLNPNTLKTSETEALLKFHASVLYWAELAAAELDKRPTKEKC
jgi:hypothetical protein